MRASGAAALRSAARAALPDVEIALGAWPRALMRAPAELPPGGDVPGPREDGPWAAATCPPESVLPERTSPPAPRSSSPGALASSSFLALRPRALTRHGPLAPQAGRNPHWLPRGILEPGLTAYTPLVTAHTAWCRSTSSAGNRSQGACLGREGEDSGASSGAMQARPGSARGVGNAGSASDAAAVAAESACAGATQAAASSLRALQKVCERGWARALHYTLLANEHALHAEQQARVAAHALAAAEKAAQRPAAAECSGRGDRASGPPLPYPDRRQSFPAEGGLQNGHAASPCIVDPAEMSPWKAAATRSAAASEKAAQVARCAREAVDKTMRYAIECTKHRYLLRLHTAQVRRHLRMRARTERLRAELGLSRWWAHWRNSHPAHPQVNRMGGSLPWAFQQARGMAAGAQGAIPHVQFSSFRGCGRWGSLPNAGLLPLQSLAPRPLGGLRALSTGEPSSGAAEGKPSRLLTRRPSAKARAAYKEEQARAQTPAPSGGRDTDGVSASSATGELSAGDEADRQSSAGGSEADGGAGESTALAGGSEEAEKVAQAAQDRVESALLGTAVGGGRGVSHEEEEGMQKVEGALKALAPAMEAVAAGPWLPTEGDRERIVEQLLDVLEGDGWRIRDAVFRMWGGERDGLRITKGLDVGSAQLALLVLFKMKEFEKEHGAPPAWQPQQ